MKGNKALSWLDLALYRPLIPQNTGNIGRTCVGLDIPLSIIGRPGFSLDDAAVKRAGLDYWADLKLLLYADLESFFVEHPPERCWFFTKQGKSSLFDAELGQGDTFVFGQETLGLPPEVLEKHFDRTLYLPMPGNIRSYNLSNTAAVAAFEAYRKLTK